MSRRNRRQGRSDTLMQGVLLLDKPADITSHDACQIIKSRLRLGKVGHGGTLDPFATGLLPLLLNGATRLMPKLQALDKVYEANIRLGVTTDTMDPTGEVIRTVDASGVTDEAIQTGIAKFLGKQLQTIPRFSAARVDGRRLYDYARAGDEVDLPTKEVTIFAYDVLGIDRSAGETVDVSVRVHCSSGTYVRALADDLGELLGVGAHLEALRRTVIGSLRMEDGVELEPIVQQAIAWRDERQKRQEAEETTVRFEPEFNTRRWSEFVGSALVPVARVLGLPSLTLDAAVAQRLASGGPLRKSDLVSLKDKLPRLLPADSLVLEAPDGLRALAVVRAACATDSLGRREDGAIVFEVERMLR